MRKNIYICPTAKFRIYQKILSYKLSLEPEITGCWDNRVYSGMNLA